jgi:hypothetical protein
MPDAHRSGRVNATARPCNQKVRASPTRIPSQRAPAGSTIEVSMRMVCAILTATCLLAAAGEADLIEWSKTRKLTRADFKGSLALPSGVGARSFIAIQASWTCDGDRFDPNIRAVFDPSRSAWRGATQSGFDASNGRPTPVSAGQILQHEQTHFDIAELVARKIRTHFAGLTDVCTRRGGTIPLAAIVEDYQRDLDEEQARYDRQTIFGVDARMQSTWTSKTLQALQGRDSR